MYMSSCKFSNKHPPRKSKILQPDLCAKIIRNRNTNMTYSFSTDFTPTSNVTMMLAMQCCGIDTNGLDMISVPIIVFLNIIRVDQRLMIA